MSLTKYIQNIFSFIGKFGVGTDDPQSAFDVQSTTEGSTPFPRMTEAQRLAIASPAIGLHVYQIDGEEAGIYIFKNGNWESPTFTWTYLYTKWSVEPTLNTTITGGDVYNYTLDGTTRYRFVPTIYDPKQDAFYSNFDGTNLTGLITTKG